MIVVVADIVAVPGRDAELLAAIQDVLEPSRAEPGCHSFVCARDIEHPDRFVMVEEWADGAAIRKHGETEHLARFRAASAGLVAEQTVTVHTVERSRTL